MLGEWASQSIKVNDEELHIVKEEDILGIVELD
jgi:co-chaperonin GroES (HSP10)